MTALFERHALIAGNDGWIILRAAPAVERRHALRRGLLHDGFERLDGGCHRRHFEHLDHRGGLVAGHRGEPLRDGRDAGGRVDAELGELISLGGREVLCFADTHRGDQIKPLRKGGLIEPVIERKLTILPDHRVFLVKLEFEALRRLEVGREAELVILGLGGKSELAGILRGLEGDVIADVLAECFLGRGSRRVPMRLGNVFRSRDLGGCRSRGRWCRR